MNTKFNKLYKQILSELNQFKQLQKITKNNINNYSLNNWIKIYNSSKIIPNFIEENLPFIQLKQKLIWQNIHRMA